MERTLTWQIQKPYHTWKIEDFLRLQGCSHHVLTHLKRTERGICLNDTWAYSSQRMQTGDILQIHLSEQESSDHIVPVPLPLSIIYEDEDILVLNKPADMPIHPSIHNYENTLANAVAWYYEQQGISFVYRCINRLDRDTSGLLIIAKHMLSGAILSQMSARREISREYLAITEGILPESGTITAPIARLEGSAIMRCVDYERGETAVTHFQRLSVHQKENGELLSLASVHLETGRTHQIRIHMKHIGHPLIGDFLYHPDSRTWITRQALHSHKLEFRHPITGEQMHFSCPLPDDMIHAIS